MKTRSRLFAAGVATILALLPALALAQADMPSGRRITPDPLDPNAGQGINDPRAWSVAAVPNLEPGSTLGTLWVGPSATVYVWATQQRLAAPALPATPRLTPPDESPGGGTPPPTYVKTSQLIAVRGPTSSVQLTLHGEVGASVYGVDAHEIYAATNVAGGGVRLYHYNGQLWRTVPLPEGVLGPAGSIVGDQGKVFFRTGSTILVGRARSWEVGYTNKQLLGGSELVSVGHDQVLAPGDYGQAVWNGTDWSWQATTAARHLVGAWGGRDAQGNLHLFATGSDPSCCGMLIWQGNEATTGAMDCCYDVACMACRGGAPGTGMGTEVWGHAVHDIYAVGEHMGRGMLMHFDGANWRTMSAMTNMPVATGMGDAPNGDFWIALQDGRLMHGVLTGVTATTGGAGSGDTDPSLPIVRPNGARGVSVEFRLARPADVSLVVYNVAGRRVATLDRSTRGAGVQRITWDARGVSLGVYLCQIEAAGMRRTARIVIDR